MQDVYKRQGMLHDIAKEMPHDKALALMKKYFPDYLNKPEAIWHQWLSQYVCLLYTSRCV